MKFLFFPFLWWHHLHNLLVVFCYFASPLSFAAVGVNECSSCRSGWYFQGVECVKIQALNWVWRALGDWSGNSPNPSFLWSPSLRHNRGSQITTSILTYLARQLINVNSLPLSPAVSSVPHAAGTSFPADRGRRHCKPKEFAFQSQFTHWLSYDFGTPAHSGLSPPFTNPCVHHSQIPEHEMHQGFDWCFVMADLFIVSDT